jgi:hypothetical protein
MKSMVDQGAGSITPLTFLKRISTIFFYYRVTGFHKGSLSSEVISGRGPQVIVNNMGKVDIVRR